MKTIQQPSGYELVQRWTRCPALSNPERFLVPATTADFKAVGILLSSASVTRYVYGAHLAEPLAAVGASTIESRSHRRTQRRPRQGPTGSH